MMPAPLLQLVAVAPCVPYRCPHYAVGHVHKGTLHSTPRPRALKVFFWVEVLGNGDAWCLNACQQRQPLDPFAMVSVRIHVVVAVQLNPLATLVAIHAPPYGVIVETHPIRRPRGAIGPWLRK